MSATTSNEIHDVFSNSLIHKIQRMYAVGYVTYVANFKQLIILNLSTKLVPHSHVNIR
jgi:hypothetical protein